MKQRKAPIAIYWLLDMRPAALATHPEGRPFYCGKTKHPEDILSTRYRAERRDSLPTLVDCDAAVRFEIKEVVPIYVKPARVLEFWRAERLVAVGFPVLQAPKPRRRKVRPGYI